VTTSYGNNENLQEISTNAGDLSIVMKDGGKVLDVFLDRKMKTATSSV
jgi:hypothetical protein